MTAGPADPHIALVVEGSGDRGAIPMLLRKHMQAKNDYRDIIGKPIPLNGKGTATVEGGIERYVQTAVLRPGCVGVLVVLDADKEPTCIEGPELLFRAQSGISVPVVVALAERDYEDWLYASVETLELGPEEWRPNQNGGAILSRLLKPRTYVKPTWQPRLTARMELHRAVDRSPSLKRFLDRFDRLCESI